MAQVEVRLTLHDDAVSWLPVEGQVVVLDLRTARYLSLNDSAARLWAVLAGGGTVGDLVASLRDEFGIDELEATRDVGAFLDDLRQRGLLDEAG